MTTTVSFKLAKLLKEKGFDKRCNGCYDEKGIYGFTVMSIKQYYTNSKEDTWNFAAPTISEVVMWLYEKHGIWIEVRKLTNKWIIPIPNDDRKGEWFALGKSYKTCEEAELECLRKLIEIVKTSKL